MGEGEGQRREPVVTRELQKQRQRVRQRAVLLAERCASGLRGEARELCAVTGIGLGWLTAERFVACCVRCGHVSAGYGLMRSRADTEKAILLPFLLYGGCEHLWAYREREEETVLYMDALMHELCKQFKLRLRHR